MVRRRALRGQQRRQTAADETPQSGAVPQRKTSVLGKDRIMRVSEAMSRTVRLTRPDETLRQAAQAMAEMDVGALPVSADDRLVGMITDRDIAVRAVAAGRSPDTPVGEIMSSDICYCFEDQDLEDVANNMSDIKVRRLPVVSRDKRLVGILSLGDMALTDGHDGATFEALCGISAPGGQHSQSGNGLDRPVTAIK
jgi:CBS domain-containing protein